MDRHQQTTRAAAFSVFSSLSEEKSYRKIAPQEGIDAANAGRAASYAHFEAIDDLLNPLWEEPFGNIISGAFYAYAIDFFVFLW